MSNDLAKVREEMFAEIKSDKALMKLLRDAHINDDVIRRNLSFIYDYLDAKRSVALCTLHGHCVNENQYHDALLVIDGEMISTVPAICPVYFQKQQLMSRFVVKDYPSKSEDIKIGYLPVRRAFNAFRTEMAFFIEGQRAMVYISAPANIGVLEEATAFLMQALHNDAKCTVGVLDFPKFIREFPSDIYKNKDVINEHIEKLLTIDYLLIHGLGNEETNTLIRETIVFPLFKGRADAKKRTAILSELSIDELSRLYDSRKLDMRVKQIITLIKNSIEREVFISATAI